MSRAEAGPEVRRDDAPVNEVRDAMVAHAQRYADLGMAAEAEELARLPDFPPVPSSMPLIIDTDIGAAGTVGPAGDVPQVREEPPE